MLSLRTFAAASFVMLAAIFGPAHAATLTVTNTNDSGAGSLRDAIAAAAPNDTIVFAPSVNGSIALITTLAIAQNVTIAGPGSSNLTLDGQNTVQVINLTAGDLTISGLTIANGKATTLGGGILISATSAVTVRNAVFVHNAGTNGGALSLSAGGRLTVDQSTFSDNSATSVGGGAIIAFGAATVTDSTFSANTAPINGGAINVQPGGTLAAFNDTFVGNTGVGLGGAMSNLGTTSVSDSTFANNSASSGAVLATGSATVTMNNNVMADNVATGAPAALNPAGTISGSNNVFFNNTAAAVEDDQTGYGTTNPIIATSEPVAPLGNYGGPTQTMLPFAGGAAVCAGSPGLLPAGLTWDQRNFPRTTLNAQGGTCLDAGADQTGTSAYLVPTLSTWMLMLLGVLLAGFGVQRARRQGI